MTRVGARKAAALAAALLFLNLAAAADLPVDPETGLVIDKGFKIVKAYCTACHSASVVRQAGKTRAGWLSSIRWMQETQGLWNLEPYENEILDYLAKNYGLPPAPSPLRPPVMPLPPPAPGNK